MNCLKKPLLKTRQTHSMEEANALATSAMIISRRLLAAGTTNSLRQRYSKYYYAILALSSAPNSTAREMESVWSWIQRELPSAKIERAMLGGQIRFTVDVREHQSMATIINSIEERKQELGIQYYSIGGPTLENVFLNVVKEYNVREEDGQDERSMNIWRYLKLF